MTEWIRFQAPRRRGIALHSAVLLVLTTSIGAMLTIASQSQPGLLIVVLLVASVLFSLLLPLFFYRLYALLRSEYSLGRSGLRLRWGLRQVDLPHELILDIALASELQTQPPAPRWKWPGSVIGLVEDEELGNIEYLASEEEGQVLLGTKHRVYVLSPENPAEFLAVYHREAERGSISDLKAASFEPSFVLSQAWADIPVRRLLLAGAGMVVVLLLLVGILSPGLTGISLGFAPTGGPLEEVPGVQLFLLPALNLAFFFASLLLGLLLYRESESSITAKLVWGSSFFTGLLFLGAILIISLT